MWLFLGFAKHIFFFLPSKIEVTSMWNMELHNNKSDQWSVYNMMALPRAKLVLHEQKYKEMLIMYYDSFSSK